MAGNQDIGIPENCVLCLHLESDVMGGGPSAVFLSSLTFTRGPFHSEAAERVGTVSGASPAQFAARVIGRDIRQTVLPASRVGRFTGGASNPYRCP